ncbi:MAG: hypothetical protein ABS944_17850 [Solibacillus sp.]
MSSYKTVIRRFKNVVQTMPKGRKYEHFKAKVLLSRVYKEVDIHLG